MPQMQHPMERRATMLAARLEQRISAVADSLTTSNGRIPFHTMMPKSEALDWWAQHRYDNYGKMALANLDPTSIANLDQSLMQYTQQKNSQGLPEQSSSSFSAPEAVSQQTIPPSSLSPVPAPSVPEDVPSSIPQVPMTSSGVPG